MEICIKKILSQGHWILLSSSRNKKCESMKLRTKSMGYSIKSHISIFQRQLLTLCQVELPSLLCESFGPDAPQHWEFMWETAVSGETTVWMASTNPQQAYVWFIFHPFSQHLCTARTKGSESAQKAVLEGVLKKDYQQEASSELRYRQYGSRNTSRSCQTTIKPS